MKTALIFYGFFRTFDFCKNSLRKHVLDPLNCDIFFDCPNTFYTPTKDEISVLHNIYSRNSNKIDENVINFLSPNLKLYNLREYESQIYIDILNKNNLSLFNDFTKQHTWRTLSYFHSISSSVNLFKKYINDNNVHYDAVILTRPDLRYYKDFSLLQMDFNKINYSSNFLLVLDDPQIQNIPLHIKINPEFRKRFGAAGVFGYNRCLNDQIITGTQENILMYGDLFEKSIDYYKEGICFNQETYLGAHCLKNGKDFVGTDFTTYEIWREDKPEYM